MARVGQDCSVHFVAIVHHTCRRAKQQIIMLVSRCSGPVLHSFSGPRLRCSFHRALVTFCAILGSTSTCLRFIFVAKIAGFTRVNVFDGLGRLRSVDLRPTCAALYNVAHTRVRTIFTPRLRSLTYTGKLACRRAVRGLAHQCSNCRFGCHG